jgi:FG-GAP repeat protein
VNRATLVILALTAGCGGGGGECSLTVLAINGKMANDVSTLSNGDDRATDLPGIQVDVRLEAIGLPDGTPVSLQVERSAGTAPSTEAIVNLGQANFAAVDLGSEDGAATLVPSLPGGQQCAISTRSVVLQTVRCAITAPQDGEVLNRSDDLDPATPGLCETAVRVATNAEDGSATTLTIAGIPAPVSATVDGFTAVFPSAALPDMAGVAVEAQVTTHNGSTATCSVTVDVDLGFDSCAITVPAAEQIGNLGFVLNGRDDLDVTAGLQADVLVTTDAPSGSSADLFANEQMLATTAFDATGGATFAAQTLPEGTLVLRATCRDPAGNELRSPPYLITVDSVPPAAVSDMACLVSDWRTAVIRCTWTAPAEAGSGLGSYDLRYVTGGASINAGNFATATVATPAVPPVPPGAPQSYDLRSDADNLIRLGSTYDIGVVAVDAAGNVGGLSNDTPPLTPSLHEQSLVGEDAQGLFGISAAAGDFNCDGIGDLAVGAPDLAGGSVSSPNRVYLYFGGPQGLPAYYDTRILSTQNSNFGGALTTLGNFDGDTQGPAGGCDDLAVGASYVEKLYVYLGRPAWFDRTDEDPGTGAEIVISGDAAGWSGKIGGGDFDGNGRGDLIYGVFPPPAGPADVAILLGFAATPMVPGGTPLALSATGDANVTILSNDTMSFGGYVSASDINGDGYDDALIGQYDYDVTPGDSVGAAYVVYGSAAPPSTIDVTNPSASFSLITGGPNNFDFGWAVNGVGDLDGDGANELAVGDLDYSIPAADAGFAYVFTGLDGGVDQTVDDAVWTIANGTGTDSLNDLLGRAFVEGGKRLDDPQLDVDQDGYADLVVAETGHGAGVGSVLVYFGGPAGPVGDTNLLSDIRLVAPAGASGGFGAGLVSVGAPDFNNDGFGDFAVTDVTYGACGGVGTCGRLTVYW